MIGAIVSGLAVTPVKGTRLQEVDEIRLDRGGARGNRRFYVIDERDRMLNGKQLGGLNTVIAEYSDAERRLALTFPDGHVVEDQVRLGGVVSTRFFSRVAPARLVDGPWATVLSDHVGRTLRLVEAQNGGSVDRGTRGAASLISRASLAKLAGVAGEEWVDARRFRMLIEVDGLTAHAEDRWVSSRVRVGEATVTVNGHAGRCLITSRHPETGQIDLPTLDILRSYRGQLATTEPLAFGVYGEVTRPGRVRLGDDVVAEG
jgi:uncharacterized protein YcbX